MWDSLTYSQEEQELFQNIVRKKDQLAGFESFVKNRYFFQLDEGITYFEEAGFGEVECIHQMDFWYSLDDLLISDFKGDKRKLEEWNQYLRECIPGKLKAKHSYQEDGDKIYMIFKGGIIKGRK